MAVKRRCFLCGVPSYGDRCRGCYFVSRQASADENAVEVKTKALATVRRWRQEHSDYTKTYSKEYGRTHKEQVKQYTVEHAAQRREHNAKRRARLLAVEATLTAAMWEAMLDLYNHECAYCLQKFDTLEQDHVLALSKGGSHTPQNVVPSCTPCNRTKATRLVQPRHVMWYVIVAKAIGVTQ